MTHLQLLSDNTAEAVVGGISFSFSGSGSGLGAFSGFAANAATQTNFVGGNPYNVNSGFAQFAEFNNIF